MGAIRSVGTAQQSPRNKDIRANHEAWRRRQGLNSKDLESLCDPDEIGAKTASPSDLASLSSFNSLRSGSSIRSITSSQRESNRAMAEEVAERVEQRLVTTLEKLTARIDRLEHQSQ